MDQYLFRSPLGHHALDIAPGHGGDGPPDRLCGPGACPKNREIGGVFATGFWRLRRQISGTYSTMEWGWARLYQHLSTPGSASGWGRRRWISPEQLPHWLPGPSTRGCRDALNKSCPAGVESSPCISWAATLRRMASTREARHPSTDRLSVLRLARIAKSEHRTRSCLGHQNRCGHPSGLGDIMERWTRTGSDRLPPLTAAKPSVEAIRRLDHVVPCRVLVDRMIKKPNECRELLNTAVVTAYVTPEEHQDLGGIWTHHPDLYAQMHTAPVSQLPELGLKAVQRLGDRGPAAGWARRKGLGGGGPCHSRVTR